MEELDVEVEGDVVGEKDGDRVGELELEYEDEGWEGLSGGLEARDAEGEEARDEELEEVGEMGWAGEQSSAIIEASVG